MFAAGLGIRADIETAETRDMPRIVVTLATGEKGEIAAKRAAWRLWNEPQIRALMPRGKITPFSLKVLPIQASDAERYERHAEAAVEGNEHAQRMRARCHAEAGEIENIGEYLRFEPREESRALEAPTAPEDCAKVGALKDGRIVVW